MSRYIDVDKLQRHGNRGGAVYWRDIEAQLTADVVEVVRCKDCFIHDVCKAVEWYGENGFCCIGERKDEGL